MGLEYKDMEGIVKPKIHIDQFKSKMGEDDDVSVISFYVENEKAAEDLMSWFERGYDFILDADRSPGEIKPNKYLVYVEMKRRTSMPAKIQEMLDDLTTLTEHEGSKWSFEYQGKEYPYTAENVDKVVPLSPRTYRILKNDDLNDLRARAGLDTKSNTDTSDPALEQLQIQAGIK